MEIKAKLYLLVLFLSQCERNTDLMKQFDIKDNIMTLFIIQLLLLIIVKYKIDHSFHMKLVFFLEIDPFEKFLFESINVCL